MLKLGRVTKVKILFLVLVFVFNFDLFKNSAAILEKGLLQFILQLHLSLLTVSYKVSKKEMCQLALNSLNIAEPKQRKINF